MNRILVSLFFAASVGKSAEISQKIGGYQGSDGESRTHGSLLGVIDKGAFGDTALTSATYSVEANVERIKYRDISKDDYMLEYFPAAAKEQQTISVNTSHTISKLTDLRLGGSYSTDSVSSSRSWSSGVGRWWFQDTIQTNLDFSQTISNRPSDSILDNDFQLVTLASKTSSRGFTAGMKHLATPTLVWGINFTRVHSDDRPRLDAYSTNVKKYFPEIKGAVHASTARLINTGEVSTATASGSLAGVQAEVAFLKELWKGAASRVSYRYVREDEETRAFGDHLVYGADSYSLGFTQDLKRGTLSQYPMTAHTVVTRSISNSDLRATCGEAGLGAKF